VKKQTHFNAVSSDNAVRRLLENSIAEAFYKTSAFAEKGKIMITTKQRSKLKALANALRPSVTVGKEELTENVLKEIDTALYHYELVKVASLQSCTLSAKDMCREVCERLGCEPVLCVGNRFVVYKRSYKENIEHIEF